MDFATMQSLLPIPRGFVQYGDYFDDMRELAQYQINSDETLVRYDWLENGVKHSFMATPIPGNVLQVHLRARIAQCRVEVRKHRGLA